MAVYMQGVLDCAVVDQQSLVSSQVQQATPLCDPRQHGAIPY